MKYKRIVASIMVLSMVLSMLRIDSVVVSAESIVEYKTVAMGLDHTAAITENGDLYCWGENDHGQVGNGSTTDQTKPVRILEHAASVSLGSHHSTAIMENGDLYCWGWNYYGQIGNGSTTDQTRPVKILEHVTSVLLGVQHSAAITENGDLYCWGRNHYGQVGLTPLLFL